MVSGLVLFVLIVLVLIYATMPRQYRDTSKKGVLPVTIVATIVVAGLCTFTLFSYGGYTWERMGVGRQNLRDASLWSLLLVVVGVVVLRLIHQHRGVGITSHKNIWRMMAPYAVWGYVQQFVALGIGANLIFDVTIQITGEGALSVCVASMATGLLFGSIHTEKLFFCLTGVMGGCFAAIFLNHPNLLPLAIAHSVLGTFQYYWVQNRDKWSEIIAPMKSS